MRAAKPTLRRDAAFERIRKAAITLFRKRGYHGTPVRELARLVRLEAGSLYYHFPSKQELLFDIVDGALDEMLEGLRAATETPGAPAERLRAGIRFHVLFHAQHPDETFISRSELRSLTPANLRRNMLKRDRYERMFRALLAAGVEAGAFAVPDVRLATTAILTMCSSVADWYSDQGPLGPEAVAEGYADMILRAVQRPSSGAPRQRPGRRHLKGATP